MSSDQAAALRQKASERSAVTNLSAIAITGGKGGVGKTSIAVNLAIALARQQRQVLLVDGDLGLANADVLLGVNPTTTLFDVVARQRPLDEALLDAGYGISLIPAASGRDEMTRLGHRQFGGLLRQLARCASSHDCVLIDTMAGISREVITFLRLSRLVLVVLTPDPTSLTDAYALIKVLEAQAAGQDIRVLVNNANSDDEALSTHARLRKVVQNYLERDLPLLGHVPHDQSAVEAVRKRRPYCCNRDSRAAQAINGIALRLRGEW